ncbi:MAG: hypothetical protein IJ112_05175 [Oscillospiraceae bacterium]|nr:hypothetical protein [Oscillospiraceae bacterium]
MQCKYCGAYNPDWSPQQTPGMLRFCVECGKQLESPREDAMHTATDAATAAAAAQAALNASTAARAARKPSGGRLGGDLLAHADPVDGARAGYDAASEPPEPPVPPVSVGGAYPPPPTPPKPTASKAPLILIGCIAALVLLAVGYFTIHVWKPADCENPETCAICGRTRGSANGHDWSDATCTEPQTCSVCGETRGSAAGHSWRDATCTEPKTCTVCGLTEGAALGHDWQPATYSAPMTCSRCGESVGAVQGWLGDVGGSFSSNKISMGEGSEGHAFVFNQQLNGCRTMTVHFKMTEYSGSPFGTFAVYAHDPTNSWFRATTFTVNSSDVNRELAIKLLFNDPTTVDSIMIVCLVNANYNFSYSLSVSDVQVS